MNWDWIVAGLAIGLAAVMCTSDGRTQTAPVPSRTIQAPQNSVPCWNAFVTPDSYTVQCASGYWYTVRPDGTIVDGNGPQDPSARALGSTIDINPGTGGPTGTVQAPKQLPMDAPHQGPMWGTNPLLDR